MSPEEFSSLKSECREKYPFLHPSSVDDLVSQIALRVLESGDNNFSKHEKEFFAANKKITSRETTNVFHLTTGKELNIYDLSPGKELDFIELSLEDELDILLQMLRIDKGVKQWLKRQFVSNVIMKIKSKNKKPL